MSGFRRAIDSSRRLALLRLLKESEGSANESVLRTGLGALGFGGAALGDGVRADLRMLEERELVRTTLYNDVVMVATITRRGMAYLAREVPQVEGVDYPSIGV